MAAGGCTTFGKPALPCDPGELAPLPDHALTWRHDALALAAIAQPSPSVLRADCRLPNTGPQTSSIVRLRGPRRHLDAADAAMKHRWSSTACRIARSKTATCRSRMCAASVLSNIRQEIFAPHNSEKIRCASDNSFQHFAELNAKAFFLRGCRCRRTVAM